MSLRTTPVGQLLSSIPRPALVLFVYAIVTAVVYRSALTMAFTSDDFFFLDIVSRASTPLVIFEPLLARFLRPLVVAVYYFNYQMFGLTAWPYHVATLLPHLATGWLVYLVAGRLGGKDETLWAFLAGLLFIVFAGHSEAVAWVAGVADPLVAACLLAAFYAYLRAIERGASLRWLTAMFVAVFAAALAKETWVAFPGFLVAHALIFGRTDHVVASRLRVALGGTVVLLASYLLFRRLLFGTVFGGLEGSGVSLQAGLFGEHVRAFLLRCFLPPGHVAATLWATGRDLLIWPAAGILVALIVRGRALRMVLFTAVSTVVALVPVLPLTISISTPESERYVYVASIFSSMLLCWFVRGVFRWPPLAAAICLATIVVHGTALIRSNAFWHSNGVLTRTVVDSFAELVLLHDPGGRSAIYLLNAPDNQEGRYVFRAGFYEAVPLLRPDVAARTSSTICIATHAVRRAQDLVQVRRTGPRSFSVDFGNNGIIQPQIPSTATFRITAQTPTSYEVEFSEALGRATVLYFSDGRMHYAGTIGGGPGGNAPR